MTFPLHSQQVTKPHCLAISCVSPFFTALNPRLHLPLEMVLFSVQLKVWSDQVVCVKNEEEYAFTVCATCTRILYHECEKKESYALFRNRNMETLMLALEAVHTEDEIGKDYCTCKTSFGQEGP